MSTKLVNQKLNQVEGYAETSLCAIQFDFFKFFSNHFCLDADLNMLWTEFS